MDAKAKALIPTSLSGGVEILNHLRHIFTPKLTPSVEKDLRTQVTSPRRRYHESPLDFYFRIIEVQKQLCLSNIHLSVSPYLYALGLVVKRQKDKKGEVVFEEQVNFIQKINAWPDTWEPAQHDLTQLATIVDHEFSKISLAEPIRRNNPTSNNHNNNNNNQRYNPNNNPNNDNEQYTPINSVLSQTSRAHVQAITNAIRNDRNGFLNGWFLRLMSNTPANRCILHGTRHRSDQCTTLQNLLGPDAFTNLANRENNRNNQNQNAQGNGNDGGATSGGTQQRGNRGNQGGQQGTQYNGQPQARLAENPVQPNLDGNNTNDTSNPYCPPCITNTNISITNITENSPTNTNKPQPCTSY